MTLDSKKISIRALMVLGLLVLLAPVAVFAQTPPINNPPVAVGDRFVTPPNEVSDPLYVLINDRDPDGPIDLTWVDVLTDPVHGTAVWNSAGGYFTYDPIDGYSGPDSFVYEICDPALNQPCPTATVSLIVANEVDFRVIPQKLNVKKNGVLPVDVRSSEDFDVTTINPESLRLQGVPPLRWNMGGKKLTLKFSAGDVVDAIGEVADRDVVVLQLTGTDLGGVAIFGEDPVIIINKVKNKPKK